MQTNPSHAPYSGALKLSCDVANAEPLRQASDPSRRWIEMCVHDLRPEARKHAVGKRPMQESRQVTWKRDELRPIAAT
jgi:hypothetical protein